MAIRTFGLVNQNRRLYTHSPRNPAESPLPVELNCLGDGGVQPKSVVVGRQGLCKSPNHFQVRRSRFPKMTRRVSLQAVMVSPHMVPIYLMRITKFSRCFAVLVDPTLPARSLSLSLSHQNATVDSTACSHSLL